MATKRKFSAAQLAAQRKFAERARAGTLRKNPKRRKAKAKPAAAKPARKHVRKNPSSKKRADRQYERADAKAEQVRKLVLEKGMTWAAARKKVGVRPPRRNPSHLVRVVYVKGGKPAEKSRSFASASAASAYAEKQHHHMKKRGIASRITVTP